MTLSTIERANEAYAYPLLIKHLLEATLTSSSAQEIVHGTRRHTYREMHERVQRLGSALLGIGIHPGDTVAVLDWDSHRYLEAYFAIPMSGASLMTANARLSAEQLTYTLNHSGAKALFVHADFLPMLESIRSSLTTVDRFVLLTDEQNADVPIGFCGEYESLLDSARPGCTFPDLDENARATIFYTTGTTGSPKGVSFSHRQLILYVLAMTAAMASGSKNGRVHRDDVYMPITPMFHVHAWGMPYMATMLGLKQVYPGRYAPDRLLSLVRDEGVTFSHCVPTVLHLMLSQESSRSHDLSKWKLVIGGSALSEGLARMARDRGIDIITGYGLSETCSAVTVGRVPAEDSDDLSARTAAGYPLPLVNLRILPVDTGDKGTGEIVVRAPWLTQSYFQNNEASEALWAGGWLHTNDVGIINDQGQLRITDRIKDVIKSGGEWISSIQLEDLISRFDDVSEVAVVGVSDAKWGERPLALVVLKSNRRPNEQNLRAHLNTFVTAGEISRHAVPEKIRFVDTLPKTSVGKLDKKQIRHQASLDLGAME